MKTICVCNQKGGSGKTTTTMLLGMAYAKAGKKVGVIDLDEQQGSYTWINDMEKLELNTYGIEIFQEGTEYDIILIDTPPALNTELKQALANADEIILTTGASKHEIQSSQQARVFIEKHAPEGARIRVLFNRVNTGWLLSKQLAEIADLIGLPMFKNYIPYLSAYQYADSTGWNGMTAKAKNIIAEVALEALI